MSEANRKNAKLVALALVAVFLIFAVSCAPEAKKHDHAVGKKQEALASTCKTKGSIEWYQCAGGCDAKWDENGVVLEAIEGELDPENHEGTPYWPFQIPPHEEVYGCCDAVKTEATSHVYQAGYCVCGKADPTVYVSSVRLDYSSSTITVTATDDTPVDPVISPDSSP
ncbi:MAG: hypothetical protein KBS81_05850 [Spirochaetales bacterium]|nr:hypothetical protein [Candidatus Physcosoma equi]